MEKEKLKPCLVKVLEQNKKEMSMEKKKILTERAGQYVFDIPKDINGKEVKLGDFFTSTNNGLEPYIAEGYKVKKNTVSVLGRSAKDPRYTNEVCQQKLKHYDIENWHTILNDAKLNANEYFEKYPKERLLYSPSEWNMHISLVNRCNALAEKERNKKCKN